MFARQYVTPKRLHATICRSYITLTYCGVHPCSFLIGVHVPSLYEVCATMYNSGYPVVPGYYLPLICLCYVSSFNYKISRTIIFLDYIEAYNLELANATILIFDKESCQRIGFQDVLWKHYITYSLFTRETE
jgi:hypothetical protein